MYTRQYKCFKDNEILLSGMCINTSTKKFPKVKYDNNMYDKHIIKKIRAESGNGTI